MKNKIVKCEDFIAGRHYKTDSSNHGIFKVISVSPDGFKFKFKDGFLAPNDTPIFDGTFIFNRNFKFREVGFYFKYGK